eukprot:7177638-Pyramimonas_sp.AAC.1
MCSERDSVLTATAATTAITTTKQQRNNNTNNNTNNNKHVSLPGLCLEGLLLSVLKGAGEWKTPRAVPPGSAPRFPQLRPLNLASLISS